MRVASCCHHIGQLRPVNGVINWSCDSMGVTPYQKYAGIRCIPISSPRILYSAVDWMKSCELLPKNSEEQDSEGGCQNKGGYNHRT